MDGRGGCEREELGVIGDDGKAAVVFVVCSVMF